MPEDESYLNKRGLTHFWENIDDIKQNKLIAGAGILITNDVISATGGGTADAVDWGHITGLMSNQADLTAALAAKANSADLATVATSGDYDDLTDKPTIGNATLTIQKNGTSAGTFTANATSNETINIAVPTTAADVSALPASTKYGASIAVSINTTDYKVTTTLKDQDGNTLGTAQVIDLPLESVVVNGSYDSTNKKIILTLQNGSTIDIPVADLVAGLQSEITSTNKLASDLVDDTNQTNKFMTSAEKTKLSGIEAGAEVNVQSDWNQTTTTADDYIKNKPSIPTKTSDLTNDSNFVSDANYVHTDNNYTTAEKDKLSGIAAGAEVNVQSDWNQTTATADDYIKNKPTLATVATSGSYNDLSNKPTIPSAQVNSDWDANSGVAQILNKPNLATVATSGSYDDLSDKPTIPTVNDATLTIQKNGSTVNTFTANASSNVTANITVPVNTSDLNNDSGFITATDYADASTGGVVKVGSGLSIDSSGVLSATASGPQRYDATWTTTQQVATQTQYDELRAAILAGDIIYARENNEEIIATRYGAPTGSVFVYFSFDELYEDHGNVSTTVAAFAVSVDGTTKAITALADTVAIPESVPTKTSDLTNDGDDGVHPFVSTDDLATVATSGSYNDLSNKPTIPTVNDATLTITQNGTSAGTFTANASSNTTIALTDTTYSNFTGATSSVAGAAGLVPAPTTSDPDKFLKGDGTWAAVSSGTSRYDASWVMSEATATQAHYDGLAAAIANGDVIYINVEGIEVVATMYGNNNGNLFVTFSYDQIYDNSGTPITTVVTVQASIDAATKAITLDTNGATILPPSQIPTKTSDLTNDGSDGQSNYVEYDQLAMVAITGSYVNLSNTPNLATVATSGQYSDLTGTPTIPTVNDATLTVTQNGTSVGTFTANASSNATIALTDTTYSAMTGATSSTAGASGLVPAPSAGDNVKYLKGDGTWGTPAGGEMFDVTISTATGATWTSDKTYAQIVAAIAAGTPFNVRVDFPPMFTAAVNSVHYSPNDGEVYFGMSFDPGSGMITETITIDSSNNITATQDALPAVNNGVLTITQGGSTLGTFTANASSNVTIDVPGGSSTITGTGAPTSSTAAEVGQFYLDTQTGNTYVCTDDTGGTYTWDTVGGGVSLTMTQTDPGEGSALAANTILGVYDGGGVTMDYSTAEQATGYTWVDGSMIYKKTVNCGALPNSTAKYVAHSITSLGKFIKLEGYGRKTNGATYPLPYASAGSGSIELYADNTNIEITTTNDRTDISECYVTLYYTKSA